MTYRIDRRTNDELFADVQHRATTLELPHIERATPAEPVTWSQVLATDEISNQLLSELVRGHHTLVDHAATLPDRAARHWLETTCGIAALSPVPAAAVVIAEVADDAGPILVEAGTQLKGPNDANGQPTVFATSDQLIGTGAQVAAIRSHARYSDADTQGSSQGEAFSPFGARSATHELYFCSDVLQFRDGRLTVSLDFTRTGIDVADIANLDWFYSGVEGEVAVSPIRLTSRRLSFTLNDDCQPSSVPTADGNVDHCWLRASTPPGFDATALAFAFDSVTITAVRTGLQPDSAWYNDGTVDVEREFKPFGDVPRRGDSFYLQSDEAFSKPLEKFSVQLAPLNQGEYDFLLALLFPLTAQLLIQTAQQAPAATTEATAVQPRAVAASTSSTGGTAHVVASSGSFLLTPFAGTDISPTIEWQVRNSDTWFTLRSAERLGTVSNLRPTSERGDSPASDTNALAGVDGHFIRAFLSAGDFGWDAYQQGLIDFANFVAKVDTTPHSMPTPPRPPTIRQVSLTYTTQAVTPQAVVTINGHSRRTITSGRPFVHPINAQLASPFAGDVQISLDLPDAALGQVLSIWFEVDGTAACVPSNSDDRSRWEVWTASGWLRIAVSDSSSSLRTSGLVRFVAPLEWPKGCPEAGATDGRWFRLATNQPERIGTIEGVYPDAVRVTALPDASGVPSDIEAPATDAVKGPTTRIAGLKKLTNPRSGLASRAPESDAAYLLRAPQVARTRNRLIQPADYELDIRARFPEVAFVAALPHFDGTDAIAPGHVGLVVIPQSSDPAPLPSAELVTRIEQSIVDRAPIHATVAVHCPAYRRIAVDARIVLAPGVASLTARAEISAAVDAWLHPSRRMVSAIGRPIYRSELIVVLEGLDQVDRVESIDLQPDDGVVAAVGPTGLVERIDAPAPIKLGMVVSSGDHTLELVERLT